MQAVYKLGNQWRPNFILSVVVVLLLITVSYEGVYLFVERMPNKAKILDQNITLMMIHKPQESTSQTDRGSTMTETTIPDAVEVGELAADSDFVEYNLEPLLDVDDTPKVALLFLTMGEIHNEPIWRAFFEAAGRLQLRDDAPIAAYIDSGISTENEQDREIQNEATRKILQREAHLRRSAECDEEAKLIDNEVKRLITIPFEETNVIASQKLFKVFTYPPKDFQFPPTSIFRETEVLDRVDLRDGWGTTGILAAQLDLLFEAIHEDNRKKRFVLLSEFCVPLYRPEMIYLSLLSETKSRVDACQHEDETQSIEGYDSRMATDFFNETHWRTSKNGFSLITSHAEILAEDIRLFDKFEEFCRPDENSCVPDEHYIPSVLAVHERDNETACEGSLTVVWMEDGDGDEKNTKHPKRFSPEEIHNDLFQWLKGDEEMCGDPTAQASTMHFFNEKEEGSHCVSYNTTGLNFTPPQNAADWILQSGFHPLEQFCPLFAGEFPKQSMIKTLAVSLSCNGGELGYWC